MKHITKFILTIVVAFMLVEIFPVNKISADTVYEAELIINTVSGPESTRYETIKAAFAKANDQEADANCIVKLLKDCAIEKQLEVDKGARFTLDLNGFTIDAQKKDRLIYINGTHDEEEKEDVGNLTIIDSSPNHTGALINGYRASGHLGGAGIEVLGQLHFLGGTIRNCRNEGYMDGQGAAIYVEGKSEASLPGYVLMGGNAKIENCYAEAEGGAVYLEISAKFKMDGGTITNCHAEIAGGAVFAFKNSTFEFNGGSINNCNVNPNYDNGGVYDACGGGVFAFSGATVNMNGGEIKNCTAKNGGGIYLKQGFRDIDEKDYSGSQGFLYGGTISNNRATAHGGGVFVQTGNEALLSSAQIARLHLKGGIKIDNNKGIEFKDGPTLDNVYLELKMDASGKKPAGTDGYRPYFYVDGNLTGRVGINADTGYYGPITFPQEIDKSQLDHLFSDDNGKVIKYKNDKINYLEKGHATILDVHLITWDSDRTSANVEIDRGSHSIKIYAARQKEDLESVFDPETIEIIWTGGRIKDENSNGQVYYDSPLQLRVFGPANREQQRCYYQRVTVFDSREPGLGSYYETWDIRIYFLNTANKVKFTAKDAEVFERHFEYSQPVWRKAQPTKKDNKGYDVYYLPLNGVLKIEPVKKEGLAFTNWTGNLRFNQCLRKTSKQNLTDSTIEFTLIKAYAHVRANYGEKQYTVDVVNGYLNEDVNKTSLATKAGETVNAHFKAPQGVDPNSIRFVKWETSGNFKLDESIVNNENISFVMPKESFTLTAIYEAKKLRVVFYYTYYEGLYRGCVTEPAYESKQIEKIVSPKMEENDIVYKFDHFETREDGSDVPLTTTELDNGNYRCSFVMPDHNVSINIHYKDSTTKYQITYYTKINGVVQDESSEFAPFSQEEPAGVLVKRPFRSKITASDGSTKDLDKFTTDSPDVEVTTTIPVDNTHLCSFTMPEHNVNIYINYYSSKYTLSQEKTIEPGMMLLDSGSTKTITAATAPEGMVFDRYELSSNGVAITDRYTIREIVKNEGPNRLEQNPLNIVMPSYNLTVTAKYKKRDYTLRQVNTSEHGNSIHNEGDVVVIKYDDNPNCIFMGYKYYDFNDGIRGNEITNPEDVLNREILDIDGKIIRITMPNKSIEIVAEEYTKPPTRYNLTQIGTQDEGISQRVANNEVNIFKETRGEKFKEYVFYDGLRLVDKNDLHFRVVLDDWCEFVMPNYDLTVVALYENSPTIKYTLTQIDTMDAGVKYYADGTKGISVDALNDIRTEFAYEFTHFDFYKENQKLEDAALDTFISKYVSGDVNSGHIKITMPSYNLAVKANYDTDPSIDQYPLTQKKTYNEGTANYKQGTEGIHIKALDIDGYTFQGWKFSSNGVEITSDTGLEQFKNIYVKFTEGTDNKEFDLTMPSFELTVEALFGEKPLPEDKHTLVEENTVHTGTYQYRIGTKVDIQALSLIDKEFDKWVFTKLDGTTTVDVASCIIGDLTKDHFTLKMPDFDLKVKATYHDIADKKYTLVQENTIQEGESTHYAGTKISIRALEIPGYSFDKWEFYDGTTDNPIEIEIKDIKKYVVDDLSSDHITLIMPQISKLIVKATFKDDPMIVHYLKQINTYDEGTEYHSEGQKIEIRALSFYGKPEFIGWEFYDKDENPITKEEIAPYISGNLSRNYFYLNMPNFDLIVKATYKGEYPKIYNLEQINTRDTGIESHYAGTQMFINAIDNANFTLTGWKFYKDGKELTEETDPTLTEFRNKYVNPSLDPVAKRFILTMPEHDLTVEAIYNETPPETMYTLTQIKTDDEGLKSYHAGTKVSIRALNIQGFNFSGWKFYKDGEEISSSELTTSPSPLLVNNQRFTLTMPNYDLTVEATYTRSPLADKYKLTTKNTTNDGEHMYYSGTKVGIEALTLPGIKFTGWNFYYGDDTTKEIIMDTEGNKALTNFIKNYVLGDVTKDEIVLIMPSQNIYVEATYNGDLPTSKYDLTQIKTVNPGTVSYYEGTKVNIKASEIQGYDFSGWKFYKGETELSDTTSPTLTEFIKSCIDPSGSLPGNSFELTMPGYYLTVEAVYTRKTVEPHKLTTINATPAGENMFYADTEIEVKADEKAGKIFDHFKVYKQDKELTGTDLTNFIATNVISKGFDSGNFTLKMPNYDLTIQSIYREPIPVTYKLTQVKTIDEGTSEHLEGTHISIQAQKTSGSYFKGWKFYKTDGSEISKDVMKAYVIGDITSDRFTLVMPKYDLKVEATFIPIADITPHSLKQINTKDEGVKEYYKGTKVTISAIDNSDLVLKGWRFYKGETELSDTTSPTLSEFKASFVKFSDLTTQDSFEFTMPAYNVTVKAEYELIAHKLTQKNTKDEGVKKYYKGTKVTISAIDNSDLELKGWKFYKDGEEIIDTETSQDLTNFKTNYVNPSNLTTKDSFVLTMPNYDLKVEAVYDKTKPIAHILKQIKTINEGEENYYAGTEVQIKALDLDGYTFQGWKFYKGGEEIIDTETSQDLTNFKTNYVNPSNLTTKDSFVLTMPDYNLTVEAVYDKTAHKLTQIKTIDEGEKNYYVGTEVQIKALDIKDYNFTGWKFYKGNKELSDTTSPTLAEFKASFVNPSNLTTKDSFVLTMPDYDLKVEATYSRLPVAHKLTLIGTYNDGESYLYENEIISIQRISDSDLPTSVTFKGWKIYKGDQELTESTTPKLSEFVESQLLDTSSPKTLKDYNLILMPNYDLKIEAIYEKGTDPTVLHKLEQVYTVDEGSSMHQTNDAITITAITPTSDSGYENNGFKYYKNIDGNYSEIPESSIKFVAKSDSSTTKDSSITIKMPNCDLKVVAQFKQTKQKYELTSISTSLNTEGQDVISFMKNADDVIEAMPKGTGTFKKWLIVDSDTLEEVEPTGKAVDDTSHKLTFKMPAKNITIMPVYDGDFDDIYWIDVVNGYANGEPFDINYKGTDIIVEASEYDGGQFTNWKVYKYKEVEVPVTKSVLLSASPETETDIVTEDISNNMTELAKLGITNKNQLYRRVLYIHQPDFDIELEAKYATGKVQLEVINGTKTYGSPTEEGYDIGSEEKIVANPCPSGMRFSHWRVLEGNPIWYENGQYLDTATLKLVDNVKVEAIYIPNPPYIIPPTGVK